MITVDLSTVASVASIIATLLAVFGLLSRKLDRMEDSLSSRTNQVETSLGARIDQVETSLGARIEQVRQEARADNMHTRAEFKADLAEVRADFRFLSERMISFLAHPPEPRPRAQGG